MSEAAQLTCVAIEGRALLIDGAPGAGKSSLALALIDRGARLVGDDGVVLEVRAGSLWALPHSQTRGLLEVRHVGIVEFEPLDAAPVCLAVTLAETAPRLVEQEQQRAWLGIAIPHLVLPAHDPALHLRAEHALRRWGLPL